mgnify:CR=1 FL=1
MSGHKIFVIGVSQRFYEALREKWKDVYDEQGLFIGHLDQLPPSKEPKLEIIFDELQSIDLKDHSVPLGKRKPMPYYHGKRRW